MKNNEGGVKSNCKGSRTEGEKNASVKPPPPPPPPPAENKGEKFVYLKTLISHQNIEETNQRKQSLGEETEQA